jgi:hypothetical protein
MSDINRHVEAIIEDSEGKVKLRVTGRFKGWGA